MQLATSNLLAPNPSLAGCPFPGAPIVPGQAAAESTAGSSVFPVVVPEAPAMLAATPEPTGAVALAFLPPMATGAWHAAPPLAAGGDLLAEGGWDGAEGGLPCGVVFSEETPELTVATDAKRLAEALANSGAMPMPLPVGAEVPLQVAECPAGTAGDEIPSLGDEADEPAFEPRRNSTLPPVDPKPLDREFAGSEPTTKFSLPTSNTSDEGAMNDPHERLTSLAQSNPDLATVGQSTDRRQVGRERPAAALSPSLEPEMGRDPSQPVTNASTAPTPTPKVPLTPDASGKFGADIERLLDAAAPAEMPLLRRENSADRSGRGVPSESEDGNAWEKSFLSNGGGKLTRRQAGAGIETAKTLPVMPNAALVSPQAQSVAPASSALLAGAEGLVERVEPQNMLALALDDVRSAHEAVEVVLRTADRLASLTHKSVKLEFAVAGERLDVRVELRANEVFTTFHTESAELRAALAQEWQGVSASAGQGERTLRLLPAEFGGAGNDTAQSSAGDAHSRQREAAQQQQLVTENAPYFGRAARGSRGTRTSAVAPVANVSFAAPGTALHLHTLA